MFRPIRNKGLNKINQIYNRSIFSSSKISPREMFKLASVNLMQGFWKFNQRQESKMYPQCQDYASGEFLSA